MKDSLYSECLRQFFRHLLCDTHSLSRYFKLAERVTFEDVRRDLMLIERKENVRKPDHFYRLGQELAFKGMDRMADLFVVGLTRLADEFLEIRFGRVWVRAERTHEWQLTLPMMPPLLLIAAKIWKERRHNVDSTPALTFIHEEITPSLRHTALLCPHVKELEDLKREQGGLHDLHLHLNGAMETDTVWQDFLSNPNEVYKEMASVMDDEKVREQYVQLTNLNSPLQFLQMLYAANQLRWKIFDLAFGYKHTWEDDEASDRQNSKDDEKDCPVPTFEQYLRQLQFAEDDRTKHRHPVQSILPGAEDRLRLECYLYIKVLDTLHEQRDNEALASLFHYYLLILGLANKMLVQQNYTVGFEEFQKYTSNGLREYSEHTYLRRFLQMSGTELDNLRFVEGRFSPKDSVWKNRRLLDKLLRGKRELGEAKQREGKSGKPLQLVTIAHFIKKAEQKKPDPYITYLELRHSLESKTDALETLHREGGEYARMTVGIDAAASEFDTPPEVFAPYYRRLRKVGYEHFTYHAGEDFFHILSGLRAVYEAIVFLDLRSGDRIGHATATGVPVHLWSDALGDTCLVRRGEYMDDLLFAHHLITEKGDAELKALLPILANRIEEYSNDVYGKYYSLPLLQQAWLYRYNDPTKLSVGNEGTQLCEVQQVFLHYQMATTQEKYKEILPVKTFDIFDEAALTQLQQLMLAEMYRRNIVIETLPTSNVLIGHHRDFRTYHLYNWYQWGKEHEVPPIVVGTDDAGVFATNIYNEYCNIFCMLKEHGCNADDIMAFIRKLDENARLYAFTPLP